VNRFFVFFALIFAFSTGFAQEEPDMSVNLNRDSVVLDSILENQRYGVGVEAGWDSPFGNGLFLTYNIIPKIEASVGGGIFLSGPKLGMGVRYFMGNVREKDRLKKFKPYFGTILSYSGGRKSITIRNGDEEGTYKIPSEQICHLFLGMDKRLNQRFCVYGESGFGIRLDSNDITELGKEELDKKANFLYTPGEFLLAMGMAYKF
jgi:hypothetical protein